MGVRDHEDRPDAAGFRAARDRHNQPSPADCADAFADRFPGISWPDGGALLATAIARLGTFPDERLYFTLHAADGGFIGAFERRGVGQSVHLRYRDIFETAFANRASGILLVHNHPSGDPNPSERDLASTANLIALCRPLELRLIDHLIVAGPRVISMRGAGLLEPQRNAA